VAVLIGRAACAILILLGIIGIVDSIADYVQIERAGYLGPLGTSILGAAGIVLGVIIWRRLARSDRPSRR